MKKPVLVVMAAGMGSRYGGLKQIEAVDPQGHIIMDFSVYDAVRAGFEEVIFIIKKENEEIFRSVIGDRVSRHIKVTYCFQDIRDLPEGFKVPEGRVKPWGTGHAVLSCRDVVDGPFVVINADDYYGSHAFKMAFDYLTAHEDDEKYRYMMVGYELKNTLTENGSVSRGECRIDAEGNLTKVTERTKICRRGEGAAYTEDGENWIPMADDTIVSMNMWGFTSSLLKELEKRFVPFLEKTLKENPMKGEYFLPFVVDELIQEGKAGAFVERSLDRWYGITYVEDKPVITAAIQELKDKGVYPQNLWED